MVNRIFKRCLTTQNENNTNIDDEISTLFLSIPYCGKETEFIVKRCKQKLYRCFKKEVKVKFVTQLKTTKLSFFTSNKDQIPFLSNSSLVYRYMCPGCSKSYIGKTECTLYKRSQQHGWEQKDSAIFQHFNNCPGYEHIRDMFALDNINIKMKEFQTNMVRDNLSILHKCNNWLTLLFMESLAIKEFEPELNSGITASKKLQLF